MNKEQFIEQVAEKSGLEVKQAKQAVNAMIDTIIEAVKSGTKVQLVGFGTFEARSRKEKMGRNPKTGEAIPIPAAIAPAFKAGSRFKDEVNS